MKEEVFVPGFVDLHIHGGFGLDVMDARTGEIEELDDRLREECGYDGWLPTTVTCAPEQALAVLESLPDRPSILGLHLEGPFLSPKHPGAQPPGFLAEYPGPGSPWDAVLDHPKLRIVTLAPEIPGGMDLLRRLVARGVLVSLGHTDATWIEANEAGIAGARHITHFFNAMRPFHHREVGIIGWGLDPSALSLELIYDRLHVSREAASLLREEMDDGLVIPVSDGTKAIGLAPGTRLTMWGLDCVVGDGDVRLASNGGLAGSAITLLDAYRNLTEDFGPKPNLWTASRVALGLPNDWGATLAFSPDLATFRRTETEA